MKICDMCGRPLAGGYSRGGALVCRDCEPELARRIDEARAEGRVVNAMHIAKKIFRESNSVDRYLLRDIPKDLWIAAKHRAIDDDISLRDLILIALREYVDRKEVLTTTS